MAGLINLVVLYGGKSGEHEISLRSAASVLHHLDTRRYHIIPVGMDKHGRFFLNQYEELLSYSDALPVMTSRSQPIDCLLVNGRFAIDADAVFPMVHGPLYEDGCLQGILQLADIPYVGCDVLSSAIGMDKDVSRRLVAAQGIRSARYHSLSWQLHSKELKAHCQKAIDELGLPLFVKPCSLGSSVGIHKVKTLDDLMAAVHDAARYDQEVLIEEWIQGREIELAVLENKKPNLPPKVSVPGEICVHHSHEFYSYMAKYIDSEQSELIVPAKLNDTLIQQLQTYAGNIFQFLKCKGMARVDFFVNEQSNEIYFNEINTIPGFTSISMYPKMWQASGLNYADLLDELIVLAIEEHQRQKNLITHYQ